MEERTLLFGLKSRVDYVANLKRFIPLVVTWLKRVIVALLHVGPVG